MQLITFLSSASALVAIASADRSAVTLDKECNYEKPHARIINRCSYDVHLWSVFKGDGCPDSEMVTLKTGEAYAENYADSSNTNVGVSIKISKTEECKGSDITQLEYYLEKDGDQQYRYNYLDVSYVDCEGMDCPARMDGYYLVAGNQTGAAKASTANTWCPILACSDAASCDKLSYVLPDDPQTKSCDLSSNIEFYLCGSEPPNGDYDSAPQPQSSALPSVSSTQVANYTAVLPTSTKQPEYPVVEPTATSVDSYGPGLSVGPVTATVTPAPTKQEDNERITKTEVVYVTSYEYINAKRHAHAHDHARRHQAFHA